MSKTSRPSSDPSSGKTGTQGDGVATEGAGEIGKTGATGETFATGTIFAKGTIFDRGSIVALAGGVGAARFLNGLTAITAPENVTAIVNTGDDREFYGALVTPDLDICTYTLAGRIDPERGFGLAGDRFHLIERLAELGHDTWFGLGDDDYANCLHRTMRLAEGRGLAEITDELRRSYGVGTRLLPMSEDPCPTFVNLAGGRRVHFEEYLIREGSPDSVESVDLSAAEAASPAPGVIEAIDGADLILVCPSNPVVSIGPILAVPGIREAIARSSAKVIAVSPIVGGAPIKGPASQLLRGIGVNVSATGVAGHYSSWIDGFVFDERDAGEKGAVEALGLAANAVDSIMVDREAAGRLAAACLELAASIDGAETR